MMTFANAPWTDEEVVNLNRWQSVGWVHEYTCPNDHSGSRVLVAGRNGWSCPSCVYTQNWAHPGALEGPPPNPFETHANPAWLSLMLELTRVVCLTHRRFNADDVMDLYDAIEHAPTTPEARAMGPVLQKAAKAGYCKKTKLTEKSRRKGSRGRSLTMWESLICEVRR
ncbi:hypothetical protein CQ14_06630 [Bradyrhizobium lablabi]|uniref:Uncharacterized protein n=1 Tax=Bradyrhizobium lablabi TaxID=722472 RepID=A0A0R3MM88_9BRAD|nr:hypothetical protein [Bradyrhizobium lablabi]KRR21319.1 hypothetical protein CQ14_06630 [Bradyrhizobium lablabi]